MLPELVLATTPDWLGFGVLHRACAERSPHHIDVAGLVEPVTTLLRLRCGWCRYPLSEPADPEIVRTLRACMT